jgi:hypothetical protein
MRQESRPSFRSAESALRFYFRAKEVLSAKASLVLRPEGSIPTSGESRRDDLMADYLTIGTSLKEFNELQLWLLRELYGPRNFDDPPRTVTRACEAGRRRFPRVKWTPQGVGRLKHHTLRMLERTLVTKGMIAAEWSEAGPVRGRSGEQGDQDGFEAARVPREVGVAGFSSRRAEGRSRRHAPRRRVEIVFDDDTGERD